VPVKDELALYRTYPVPYELVFSELSQVLASLEFEVIHSDPELGMILANREKEYAGYYEFHMRQATHGIELWVRSGRYRFLFSGDWLEMNDRVVAHLDDYLKTIIPMADQRPGDHEVYRFPTPPDITGLKKELGKPSPSGPATLAFINFLAIFGSGFMGGFDSGELLRLLLFASPFFIAGLLILLRFYKTGAFICVTIGFILNLFAFYIIGLCVVVLIILTLMAGSYALRNAKLQSYYDSIHEKRAQQVTGNQSPYG
jgi:hypothetical protein